MARAAVAARHDLLQDPEPMGFVTDAAAAWERDGDTHAARDEDTAAVGGVRPKTLMPVSSLPELDAPPRRDVSEEFVAQDAMPGDTPRLAEGLESEASLRGKLAADVPHGADVSATEETLVSVKSSPAGLGTGAEEEHMCPDSSVSAEGDTEADLDSAVFPQPNKDAVDMPSSEPKRTPSLADGHHCVEVVMEGSSPAASRGRPLKDIGPSPMAVRLAKGTGTLSRGGARAGTGKGSKYGGARVSGSTEGTRANEKFDDYQVPKDFIKAGKITDATSAKRKVRWQDDMPDNGLPVCAVLGAETLLGGHVVKAILDAGTHVVRAVFESAEEVEFLLMLQRMSPTMISFADVGLLSANGAAEVLSEALLGVQCVVNCCELSASPDSGRGAKVADRAVSAAHAVIDAVTAESSTVTRLVHCGSDLSVFDPRSGGRRSASLGGMDPIEPELDENCWYAIDDKERKNSDGEAFGKTAAEMLLWARAAKEDAPFTMCSVVSSLMLGPLLTPGHVSSPAHKLVVDYVTKAHAIPIIPTPIVDCRDVAGCITKLIDSHEGVCGRIFMSSESLTSVELVNELRSQYPGFSWPSRQVPRWAVSPRIAVPWKMTRRGVKERYGRSFSLSTRRAVSEVGISFRETCTTIRDTVESLQALACIDLHTRKSSRIDPGGRISSRFYSGGIRISRRRAASGRV